MFETKYYRGRLEIYQKKVSGNISPQDFKTLGNLARQQGYIPLTNDLTEIFLKSRYCVDLGSIFKYSTFTYYKKLSLSLFY